VISTDEDSITVETYIYDGAAFAEAAVRRFARQTG
jgi:hypothetical protein